MQQKMTQQVHNEATHQGIEKRRVEKRTREMARQYVKSGEVLMLTLEESEKEMEA